MYDKERIRERYKELVDEYFHDKHVSDDTETAVYRLSQEGNIPQWEVRDIITALPAKTYLRDMKIQRKKDALPKKQNQPNK